MELAQYLRRIDYDGQLRVDAATLTAIHRAHQLTVPFENLDVQLRRPVRLDPEWAFEKIVRQRRGGWCYEMNGVLDWALREIGFDVLRVSAGVMRERFGDVKLGNHLCLLVQLEQPYLVDVGFGGSMIEPLPLRAGERVDVPYRVQLGENLDGYWRYNEIAEGEPFSYDFRAVPADEALLARQSVEQQTSPDSNFVQNLVVQRRTADTHRSLRGRVLTTLREAGTERQVLNSAADLVRSLRDEFDLDLPEAASLWPAVCARHDAVFGG